MQYLPDSTLPQAPRCLGTPGGGAAASCASASFAKNSAGQQRQNELLAELTQFTAGMHKQRAAELQQWKDANPGLAKACRRAAETLNRVQTRFLESITEEVDDNAEHLEDGDFMLHEFVDRFGPRLAHLNGVLQVLAQLSDAGNTASKQK